MPVMIIGVGGTGTEIIQRIHEIFHDQEGALPRHVALGVVDARTDKPQTGKLPGVTFTANRHIQFASELHRLRNGGLLHWWPERVHPSSDVDFSDGCGAMRPNGRFYATFFASKIETTIRKMHDQLARLQPGRAGMAGNPWEVFVVSSLGNGTGGGAVLEVATIAKSYLSRQIPGGQIACTGVFIPGSVTRTIHTGSRMELRVGANGFASLLDLQYEFNRNAPGDTPRPATARALHTSSGSYSCGDSPEIPPIDGAYLIDGSNKLGQTADYPTLLNLAAQSLALLVGGVDETMRLLDAWVAAPTHERFASLCGVTLTAPAQLIQRWATHAWSARLLDRARNPAPATWDDLLADTSPDAKRHLGAEQANVSTSVAFFVEHVIRVRETGPDGGADFNQLFERFTGDGGGDQELEAQLRDLLARARGAEDRDEIVNHAQNIASWVERQIVRLEERDRLILLDGENSEWSREPSDPADPGNAGIQWLLNRRVRQFVGAGAFGLLRAWLEELEVALRRNRDSVLLHERRTYLRNEDAADLDLMETVGELKAEADRLLAIFRKGAIREDLSKLLADAEEKFRFYLWSSKIEAVEALYDRMIDYVHGLQATAEQVVRFLGHDRIEGRLRAVGDGTAKNLDAVLDYKVESGEGLRAEFYVGGEAAMREALLQRFAEAPASGPSSVLEALGETNHLLFQSALATLRSNRRPDLYGPEEEASAGRRLDEDAYALADTYRSALLDAVRERTDETLRSETQIDRLLEQEASRMLGAFFEAYFEHRDAVDKTAQNEVRGKMSDRVGEDVFEQIRRDRRWEHDYDGAWEHGRDLYIAGRIRELVNFTAPMWLLQPEAHGAGQESAFVLYPTQARLVGQALQIYGEQFSGGQDTVAERLSARPSPILDPRRVYIARTEVGVGLDALQMDYDRELYERANQEEVGFSPHPTREYEDAGRRLLEAQSPGTNRGSSLVALAETLEVLESDAQGNFRLAVELPGDPATGRRSFPAGDKLGPSRGTARFVRWLSEGRDDDARALADGLGPLLYDRLRTLAFGDPSTGVSSLGWDGVARKLYSRAGEIRTSYADHAEPTFRNEKLAQAKCLEQLGTELVQLNGAAPPQVLR